MKHLTDPRPLFTVGVASSLVGVSPQTLRNWEARGLIEPRRHGRVGRRLYTWQDIERLQAIRYLVSRKHVPLRAVRAQLRSGASRPTPAAQPGEGHRGAPLPARLALAVPR